MQIAVLGPTYPFRGGISHHTTFLVRTLITQGHNVRFFSFKRQYPNFLFPGRSDRDPSRAQLSVDSVDYLLDPMNPWTWSRTARAIVEINPELVVIPWWVSFWGPPFTSICRYIKRHSTAEILFLCHNVIDHESKMPSRWLTRRTLSLGDRFLVYSHEEAEVLHKMLPGTRVAVHPHPAYSGFMEQQIPKAEARAKLGLGPEPVLLFFGFVREYKGLDILLRAVPLLLQHTPVQLLVAGEFWQSKNGYMQLIQDLGLKNVVHVYDRYIENEELPVFFGACDLVVIPYRNVTGSGVAQLGLGFGRPVIATLIGSLDKAISDGKVGRLVKPDDIEELARVINESLRPDQLTLLTDNASRHWRQNSWEDLADAVVKQVPDTGPVENKIIH